MFCKFLYIFKWCTTNPTFKMYLYSWLFSSRFLWLIIFICFHWLFSRSFSRLIIFVCIWSIIFVWLLTGLLDVDFFMSSQMILPSKRFSTNAASVSFFVWFFMSCQSIFPSKRLPTNTTNMWSVGFFMWFFMSSQIILSSKTFPTYITSVIIFFFIHNLLLDVNCPVVLCNVYPPIKFEILNINIIIVSDFKLFMTLLLWYMTNSHLHKRMQCRDTCSK